MNIDARLIDLWEEVREDPALDRLRTEGARLVPGFGQRPTSVMIVADAPEAMDSTASGPFSGLRGRTLRQLADLAGLRPEDNCWMTYLVKYRAANRISVRDVLNAQPHLRREWQILGAPPVIVAVGNGAWSALAPPVWRLRDMHGRAIPLKGDRYVWGMLPPGYGLSHPQAQDSMERDWEELGRWLREDMNLL